MTDEQIIRWACEWVGWLLCDNGETILKSPYQCGSGESINDLTEAVRVKYGTEPEGAVLDDGRVTERLAAEWFNEGPLGFLRAVHGVVEG